MSLPTYQALNKRASCLQALPVIAFQEQCPNQCDRCRAITFPPTPPPNVHREHCRRR